MIRTLISTLIINNISITLATAKITTILMMKITIIVTLVITTKKIRRTIRRTGSNNIKKMKTFITMNTKILMLNNNKKH